MSSTLNQLNSTPPLDPLARELTGQLARVQWVSPGKDFIIAKLTSGETIKGPLDEEELQTGVRYRFLGKWEENARFGAQFSFGTYIKDQQHSKAGVVKYLVSEASGIGEKKAEQLWELFGANAVATVRETPELVVKAGILTADQADIAAGELSRAQGLEKTKIDLFGLFAGRGFTARAIARCIARWGVRAADVARRNPYALLTEDIPSAGFKRCDRLYLDLGYKRDRLKRQMLAAWNHLHQDSTGHTWFRLGQVEEVVTRQVVGANVDPVSAVILGKRGGWLATRRDPPDSDRIYVAEWDRAHKERMLAGAITRLLAGKCVWPREFKAVLSDHQRGIVSRILTAPVSILAGTPGTGKTFTAAAIVDQLGAIFGLGPETIALCAPTGKAAVRLTASMQRNGIRIPATTIHRLLEIGRNGHDGKGWGFVRNDKNQLEQRFIIVDEASMLDTSLACDLLVACADHTHVLLIGDPYQLPPVGHGAPLRDLIASGVVPAGELTEIQRNAGEIVRACAAIKDGKPFETCERYEPETGENLLHLECEEPGESLDYLRQILSSYKESGKFDPTWDTQVLVGVNRKSELGRAALNKDLQGLLNPAGQTADPNPFRVDDKLVCVRNTGLKASRYDRKNFGEVFVANGEIGRVKWVEPKLTVAEFENPARIVDIPMGKVRKEEEDGDGSSDDQGGDERRATGKGCDFDLGYALTGHKSQGSEWPVVIVMIDKAAGMVCSREWVYTAISRAAKLCILIGPRGVLNRQCKRVSLGIRKTFLKELVREGAGK